MQSPMIQSCSLQWYTCVTLIYGIIMHVCFWSNFTPKQKTCISETQQVYILVLYLSSQTSDSNKNTYIYGRDATYIMSLT